MRRIDTEVDGDGRDALVGARQPVGLFFDLHTDLIKVHKLTAFTVQELCVFYRGRGQSIRRLTAAGAPPTGSGLQPACFAVDQLEDEGTTGDDARSPRQKVPGRHAKFDRAASLKEQTRGKVATRDTFLLVIYFSVTSKLLALLIQGLTCKPGCFK